MAHRSMLCLLALILGSGYPVGAEPCVTGASLVQRTYPVADLVIPVDNYTQPRSKDDATPVTAGKPEQALHDKLLKLIVETIEPESWSDRGGRGTLDYFPLGMALVVNQTPAIQQKVADLLDSLRRLQDVEVTVETRIVSVSQSSWPVFKRRGVDFNLPREGAGDLPQVTFLGDKEVLQLLEAIQGDRQASVLAAPKLTMFNGQSSTIQIVDHQAFVTGLEVVAQQPDPPPACPAARASGQLRFGIAPVALPNGGQLAFVAKEQSYPLGFELSLQPVVAADERSVRLKLNGKLTELESSTVPAQRVAVMLESKNEDGVTIENGFTCSIQAPKFFTLTLDRTLSIPAGSTAVLSGWKRKRECAPDRVITALGQVPWLGSLFKAAEPTWETDDVLMLVTPRIIHNLEEEFLQTGAAQEFPAALRPLSRDSNDLLMPKSNQAVAKLLARYEQACREGRFALAKKLAGKALALDPTCFRNRR